MPHLPPELRVEIRKVGDQYLAVTERANQQEICTNTFTHDPKKLIHEEPTWMLEKGARAPDQALRFSADAAGRPPDARRTTNCWSSTANGCTATSLATGPS